MASDVKADEWRKSRGSWTAAEEDENREGRKLCALGFGLGNESRPGSKERSVA